VDLFDRGVRLDTIFVDVGVGCGSSGQVLTSLPPTRR